MDKKYTLQLFKKATPVLCTHFSQGRKLFRLQPKGITTRKYDLFPEKYDILPGMMG
ncbi:MAG: hypothetical protein AB7E36_06940 [Salinivirgaceae bacterium]